MSRIRSGPLVVGRLFGMSDRGPPNPSPWRPPSTSRHVTSSTYTYYQQVPWHSINMGGDRLSYHRGYRSLYRDGDYDDGYYCHERQSRHWSYNRRYYSQHDHDHRDERSRSPKTSSDSSQDSRSRTSPDPRSRTGQNPHSRSSPDPRTRPPQRPLVVVNESCKDLVVSLPTLTVMTYNVLASQLIESNRYLYRREDMEVLEWDYRKGRLLQEMIDSGADIICLQEVQDEHYTTWYYPQLRSYRYQGYYQKRTGSHVDGSAIFFKEDSLQLVEYAPVLYQKHTGIMDRDNVGLVCRFRFSSGGECCTDFCVAATHILYNPKAGEVKLAQIAYLLAKLHDVATSNGGDLLPCILCGDFNSLPNSPFINFLLEGRLDYSRLQATDVAGYNRSPNRTRLIPTPLLPGKLGIGQDCVYQHKKLETVADHLGKVDLVPNDHAPKKDNDESHMQSDVTDLTGDDATAAESPSKSIESSGKNLKVPQSPPSSQERAILTHPFNFSSSYPLPSRGSDGPTITTYHKHAQETVDYLLYTPNVNNQTGFRLLSRWALPSRHTLLRLGPQPNDILSSDHLYLMAKFQLLMMK